MSLCFYISELTSSMQDVALRSFTSWESSSSPARRLLACLTFGISVTVLCTLRRHDRYQSRFLLAGILCSLTIGLVSGASQDMLVFGCLLWVSSFHCCSVGYGIGERLDGSFSAPSQSCHTTVKRTTVKRTTVKRTTVKEPLSKNHC